MFCCSSAVRVGLELDGPVPGAEYARAPTTSSGRSMSKGQLINWPRLGPSTFEPARQTTGGHSRAILTHPRPMVSLKERFQGQGAGPLVFYLHAFLSIRRNTVDVSRKGVHRPRSLGLARGLTPSSAPPFILSFSARNARRSRARVAVPAGGALAQPILKVPRLCGVSFFALSFFFCCARYSSTPARERKRRDAAASTPS